MEADDLAAFARDGYLIVDDIIPARDLSALECDLRALARKPWGIAETYDAAFRLPSFLRIISGDSLALRVNMLLGRRPFDLLYATANRVLIAPPNDESRTWKWHRETQYTITGSRFIQTWFPLISDSSEENGTIMVCPGSHLDTDPQERWIEEPGRVRQCVVSDEAVARYRQISLPMKLGQCLLFDSRLFHRSGVNTSKYARMSGVGMYHDVDAAGFKPPVVRYEYR